MQNTIPSALTFAGADPTSGAGLQADILTFVSMGCHPLSVVTAVTVQDTTQVHDFMVVDAELLAEQARAVLEDGPIAVFKVGMIGSIENMVAIAQIVSDYPDIPLVLDPILASGGGNALATEEMAGAMRELLLPLSTIITPNSIEARRLLGDDLDEEGLVSLDDCAQGLLACGAEYVLITGTHENTPTVQNTLYGQNGKVRTDHWARLPASYHGSGCTLASAIAAGLANGLDVSQSVKEAQEYTWKALEAGYRIGMGQLVADRLFWARQEGSADGNV